MLNERQIESIANDVLKRVLASSGFVGTRDIDAKPDHNDEDALYITVVFEPGALPTSGAASARAMEALTDELSANGETRFPYLVYEYVDDERPYEAVLDEGSP